MKLDLFCQIVDNYGDAGIGWRLACQLADELPADVTLWIDQPEMLATWRRSRAARIRNGTQAERLVVRQLTEATTTFDAGDVCISLLAAELSDAVLQAIQRRGSLWIRYEYLTAELWAQGCHAVPSPHPTRRLTQWFFFPGFAPESGGLLREQGLQARHSQFSAAHQHAWLNQHQLHGPNGALTACVFGYPDQPLRSLIDALRHCQQPIHLILHENCYAELGCPPADPGLTFSCHSWLDQTDFDHLLWSCDLNLVRGEESWIRAHWAQQPFLWQPYRQPDDAHIPKLQAFLERLTTGQEGLAGAAQAIENLSLKISPAGGHVPRDEMAFALAHYLAELPAVRQIHRDWTNHLYQQPSAVDQLRRFIADQLQ